MYDYDEPRSNIGLIFLLGLVLCSLGLVAWYFLNKPVGPADQPVSDLDQPTEARPAPKDPFDKVSPEEIPQTTPRPLTAEEILADLEPADGSLEPKELVFQIGKALEEGELKKAATLIGSPALKAPDFERLEKMIGESALRLHEKRPISEIGELEANRRARWALNLDDRYASRIYLDLGRTNTGRWVVESIKLPPPHLDGEPAPRAIMVDALGIADAFLQAALEQKFEDARSFVEPGTVSDATIAGLCIVFEEGEYSLREEKPLRAMFSRDTSAGFMANVTGDDGKLLSQFGLIVQRPNDRMPWKIVEINLDNLLADYAGRVAGGDVHYTPLVNNPQGGDSLILYFGFDEKSLTPRTERQLDIVANLLKLDPDKNLTLSGYTDALGTDAYNAELSAKRAASVKAYLIEVGVPATQITTIAAGSTNPRQPNFTETGEDNPLGRRANRRTEIYLDF